MTHQDWYFIIGQIVTAAGVYAAIRADLADIKARLARAEKDLERLL
jgi:hypothetical protein